MLNQFRNSTPELTSFVFLIIAFSIFTTNLYIGYTNPFFISLQADGMSSGIETAIFSSVNTLIIFGFVVSLLQSVSKGSELFGWLLIESPVIGAITGVYIANIVKFDTVSWFLLGTGVLSIGVTLILNMVIFYFYSLIQKSDRGFKQSESFIKYSFLFIPVSAIYVLSGVALSYIIA